MSVGDLLHYGTFQISLPMKNFTGIINPTYFELIQFLYLNNLNIDSKSY